jgi:hypothetical protein
MGFNILRLKNVMIHAIKELWIEKTSIMQINPETLDQKTRVIRF